MRWPAWLLLWAVSACAARGAGRVAFTSIAVPETMRPAPVRVVMTEGALRLHGAYIAPCGALPSGSFNRRSRTVVLRIRPGTRCPPILEVASLRYDALLSPVSPGTYRVRVVHESEAAERDSVVFDQQVQVQ
jgi:hypothetical protein